MAALVIDLDVFNYAIHPTPELADADVRFARALGLCHLALHCAVRRFLDTVDKDLASAGRIKGCAAERLPNSRRWRCALLDSSALGHLPQTGKNVSGSGFERPNGVAVLFAQLSESLKIFAGQPYAVSRCGFEGFQQLLVVAEEVTTLDHRPNGTKARAADACLHLDRVDWRRRDQIEAHAIVGRLLCWLLRRLFILAHQTTGRRHRIGLRLHNRTRRV